MRWCFDDSDAGRGFYEVQDLRRYSLGVKPIRLRKTRPKNEKAFGVKLMSFIGSSIQLVIFVICSDEFSRSTSATPA